MCADVILRDASGDPRYPGPSAAEEAKCAQLRQEVLAYTPQTPAEQDDRLQMLADIERLPNILYRDCTDCHMTASSWIVNPQRTHALMIWHNIYRSWSWTGGHCDGDPRLLETAMREACEECGFREIKALSSEPISLEICPVEPHLRRGLQVPRHLHYNLTYLLEADDRLPLSIKADENSDIAWIPFEKVCEACSEPDMIPIYQKLMLRARSFDPGSHTAVHFRLQEGAAL